MCEEKERDWLVNILLNVIGLVSKRKNIIGW